MEDPVKKSVQPTPTISSVRAEIERPVVADYVQHTEQPVVVPEAAKEIGVEAPTLVPNLTNADLAAGITHAPSSPAALVASASAQPEREEIPSMTAQEVRAAEGASDDKSVKWYVAVFRKASQKFGGAFLKKATA